MRIKKGDTVLIISGKDRGKQGKVLEVFPKEKKATVESVNLKKKHRKPKKSGEKGQIVSLPAPVFDSNLKFICPKCSQAVRLGYKVFDNKKIRICKKCGQET